MGIIYNLLITIYGFIVGIAANFNQKAKLWHDGRKNWLQQLKQNINPNDRVIWVHCSSLGEFEQGRPVIEKIKIQYPNHKIALSFFSPSGFEIRKNYEGADYIFYLPLDTKSNMKKLVKALHPEVLILVKYEYWYNLIKRLSKKNIPIIVISAVIRDNSLFFKPYGSWFRRRIKTINHFFVQENDSKSLLESISINQITVAGDTRFDRVKEISSSHFKLDFVENFKQNQNLLVVGSSWPDDENIITNYFNQNLPKDWKIIFAPHNIDQKQIDNLTQNLKLKTAIYSKNINQDLSQYQVLIVDTIGLLTKIYAYADISYVGGGFTKTGVHNTLEPAVYGKPLIFGPTFNLYFEAIELIQVNAAVTFENQFEFDQKFSELIQNPMLRIKNGKNAANYIQAKPNSTQIIMDYLKKLIPTKF